MTLHLPSTLLLYCIMVCEPWISVVGNAMILKTFESSEELRAAVDAYLDDPAPDSAVAQMYGWPIGSWHVEAIQDFSHLFDSSRNPKAAQFNEDLDCWSTASASDMSYMFAGATAFNGDVELFDTSLATSMQGMFEEARSLDRDLSCWDVSSVHDFSYMFRGAASFQNGHLDAWCTSCSDDLGYMFYLATNFNDDLSDWDVSGVTDFRFLFSDASMFDQSLCSWLDKISSDVTDSRMGSMFELTSCPSQADPGSVPYMTMCYECDAESLNGIGGDGGIGSGTGKRGKRGGQTRKRKLASSCDRPGQVGLGNLSRRQLGTCWTVSSTIGGTCIHSARSDSNSAGVCTR